MNSPVTKAVILTAGLGTRFFPVTKVVPKALLPIVNKPIIHYLVEEAYEAGITDILIVIAPGQEAIQRYFTTDPSLIQNLKAKGKSEPLAVLHELENLASIQFTTQNEPKGDGDALLLTQDFIGDDPCIVLFGDEIIDAKPNAIQQLVALYNECGNPIISVTRIDPKDSAQYGIIDPKPESYPIEVQNCVEKPSPEKAPSHWGIIGKYLVTPKVLKTLESAHASHTDGELRLIDGLKYYLEQGGTVNAKNIEGKRFDTGSTRGFLAANAHFGTKQ